MDKEEKGIRWQEMSAKEPRKRGGEVPGDPDQSGQGTERIQARTLEWVAISFSNA